MCRNNPGIQFSELETRNPRPKTANLALLTQNFSYIPYYHNSTKYYFPHLAIAICTRLFINARSTDSTADTSLPFA